MNNLAVILLSIVWLTFALLKVIQNAENWHIGFLSILTMITVQKKERLTSRIFHDAHTPSLIGISLEATLIIKSLLKRYLRTVAIWDHKSAVFRFKEISDKKYCRVRKHSKSLRGEINSFAFSFWNFAMIDLFIAVDDPLSFRTVRTETLSAHPQHYYFCIATVIN